MDSESEVVTVTASSLIRPLVIAAVVIIMSGIVAAAVLISGVEQPWRLIRIFYLDAECNLPTWFSSGLLSIAALLLWMNGIVSGKNQLRIKWQFLAAVFVALSLDEISEVHELLIPTIRRWRQFTGLFYFTWVLVAIPAVAALTLVYWSFVWSLPASIRRLTIAAAGIYVGGALGMEMLNGAYASMYDLTSPVYRLMTIVEECLEIGGLVVWIYALARLLEMRKISIVFAAYGQPTSGDTS